MYQSRLFFISTLAVIASCALLISVAVQYPEAISNYNLIFLECFAIFNLFQMSKFIRKEKSQTNKTNEEIQ